VRRFGLFLCLSSLLFVQCSSTSSRETLRYPPWISLEDLNQRIEKVPVNHPRLLVSAEDLQVLKTMRTLADAVLKQARLLMEIPPVERRLQGRRLLAQSRRCLKRVIVLSMAYHLSGDSRFAGRGKSGDRNTSPLVRRWENPGNGPSQFLGGAKPYIPRC